MIALLRVDHRLIHGQVALGWVRTLGADAILVANDEIGEDQLRKSMLKMAKPAETKLVIKSISQAAAAINSGKTDSYTLLIITETIADAVRLANLCPTIGHLNLGGTRKQADCRQVTNTVFVSSQDIAQLQALAARGVEIEARTLPNDRKVDLDQLRRSLS